KLPWARLMMPMMPKISVRPLATRNSSSPCCKAVRHWMRKMLASMSRSARGASELAAARRVGQLPDRDVDHLVLLARHLAQVEVLHRVAGRGQRELAARTVDGGAAHGVAEGRLVGDIALHRLQAHLHQLRRVVALHGVYVGLHVVGLAI